VSLSSHSLGNESTLVTPEHHTPLDFPRIPPEWVPRTWPVPLVSGVATFASNRILSSLFWYHNYFRGCLLRLTSFPETGPCLLPLNSRLYRPPSIQPPCRNSLSAYTSVQKVLDTASVGFVTSRAGRTVSAKPSAILSLKGALVSVSVFRR
jgi:hypothetical protein